MTDVIHRRAHINLFSKEDTTNPTKFRISQGQLSTLISTGGSFEFTENNSTTTNVISRFMIVDEIKNSVTELSSRIDDTFNSLVIDPTSLNTKINIYESLFNDTYNIIESNITQQSIYNSILVNTDTSRLNSLLDIVSTQDNSILYTLHPKISVNVSRNDWAESTANNAESSLISLTSKFSIQEVSIISVISRIDNLNTNIDNLNTNIDNFDGSSTLSNNVGKIDILTSKISTFESTSTTDDVLLTSKISTFENTFTSLNTKFSNLDSNIVFLQTKISDSETSINSINTLLTNTSSMIYSVIVDSSDMDNTYFNKFNSLQSKINNIEFSLSSVDNSLQTRISDYEQSISIIDGKINDSITSVDIDITNMENSLNNIYNNCISLYSSISIIESIPTIISSISSNVSNFDSFQTSLNTYINSQSNIESNYWNSLSSRTDLIFDTADNDHDSLYSDFTDIRKVLQYMINADDTTLDTLNDIIQYFSINDGVKDIVAIDSRITSLNTGISQIEQQLITLTQSS